MTIVRAEIAINCRRELELHTWASRHAGICSRSCFPPPPLPTFFAKAGTLRPVVLCRYLFHLSLAARFHLTFTDGFLFVRVKVAHAESFRALRALLRRAILKKVAFINSHTHSPLR